MRKAEGDDAGAVDRGLQTMIGWLGGHPINTHLRILPTVSAMQEL